MHEKIILDATTGEHVYVSDSARVNHTYLGIEDERGNVALVDVPGADALEALARTLLERAAQVRRDTEVLAPRR